MADLEIGWELIGAAETRKQSLLKKKEEKKSQRDEGIGKALLDMRK